MWPFSSRGSRGAEVAQEPRDLPAFSEFARNDASIKVWLPTTLTERLDWISKQTNVSRPDVLRALLFEHLYGRVAYMALLAHEARRAADESLAQARLAARTRARLELGEATFSSERNFIDAEFIGKSTDNLRFELPQRLKDDLANLARTHGLDTSSYVRKMLVQQLLGEPKHSDWQVAVGTIGADVRRLEASP